VKEAAKRTEAASSAPGSPRLGPGSEFIGRHRKLMYDKSHRECCIADNCQYTRGERDKLWKGRQMPSCGCDAEEKRVCPAAAAPSLVIRR
jgi:hypothetical protein